MLLLRANNFSTDTLEIKAMNWGPQVPGIYNVNNLKDTSRSSRIGGLLETEMWWANQQHCPFQSFHKSRKYCVTTGPIQLRRWTFHAFLLSVFLNLCTVQLPKLNVLLFVTFVRTAIPPGERGVGLRSSGSSGFVTTSFRRWPHPRLTTCVCSQQWLKDNPSDWQSKQEWGIVLYYVIIGILCTSNF